MKKVLITGVSGFVGQYLVEQLLTQNSSEITGIYRSEKSLDKLASLKSQITLKQLDINHREEVNDFIASIKPDYIYHLAAHAITSESFQNPNDILVNNITGQVNILEALRQNNLHDTKILIVSSGQVYGDVKPENLPITEQTELRPTNPYAVSKITQDYLGLQYYLAYKLFTIRVRPFNHIGPRQDIKLVVPAFAKQIAEIENGLKEPVILVGNLQSKRDFTDVRDIVRAYILLIEKGQAGEVYNIGSGVSIKIHDMLEKLLSYSKVKVTIKVDEARLRPGDIEDIRADHTKLTQLTGWKPEIPIDNTLQEILDYWRKMV